MEDPSMLGYIRDQGRALKNTFEIRQVFCEPLLALFQERDIKKVYLLGSGTSYNASLAICRYFEKYLPVEAEAMIPTVFTGYTRLNNHGMYSEGQILVIGISQSGTSVSTIEAMKRAKKEEIYTVAVTEDKESPITEAVDLTVKLTCGKELIPVETRGYTVTLLQGYLTVLETAYGTGRLPEDDYRKMLEETRNLLDRYDDILALTEKWYEKNKVELLGMKKAHIASYGLNSCTGLEGELKLYETFKKPVRAYEMEEMIHGPQMAFDRDTYLFFIASDEAEFERVPLFTRFFAQQHVTDHIFVFTNREMELGEKDLFYDFPVPAELSPLVFTLPFQIIAARNCIETGIDTGKRPGNRKSFAHIWKGAE